MDAAEVRTSTVTLLDVFRARARITPYVQRTPLIESRWLADAAGCRVSIKVESLQVSSSFKARGAYNAVIALRERSGGVAQSLVTASAGNHGRALAMAAEAFGLPLMVFTPRDAPRTKLEAITRHGAALRAEGKDYEDTERMARAFAASTGATFVSAYNDADVVAGAGTIALEMFEDAPDLDTIVVPIGGGGLVAGVAIAAKTIAPACRVIGIEASASCPFLTGVRAGRLIKIVPHATLADGLAGNPDADTMTFEPIQRLVDEIVTVSEDEIARAIVGLVEAEHLIAEGAAAVGFAAMMTGRVTRQRKHTAVILSGSSIDRARLAELLSNTRP